VDRFKFYSTGHSFHRFMNPTNIDKLMELGWVCGLEVREGAPEAWRLTNLNAGQFAGTAVERRSTGRPKMVLDMGCGKGGPGFLLAENFVVDYLGIDLSEGEISQAQAKKQVAPQGRHLEFMLADGREYARTLVAEGRKFDLVMCLGATFIFGAVEDTIAALEPCLAEGGVMVIGEATLNEIEGAEAFRREVSPEIALRTDWELLQALEQHGYDLTYLIEASLPDWDRYESLQWLALHRYLAGHPGDETAKAFWERKRKDKAAYLQNERRFLGWKIFVLERLGELGL
jgi:SAM-dependent methyltransferase